MAFSGATGQANVKPLSVATALERFASGHKFAAEILARAEAVANRLQPDAPAGQASGDAGQKPSNGLARDLDEAHSEMAELLTRISAAVDRIQRLVG